MLIIYTYIHSYIEYFKPRILNRKTSVFSRDKIQQRYILSMLLFGGTLVAYVERTCLSMAITQMVRTPNIDSGTNSNETVCPMNEFASQIINSTNSIEGGTKVCY